MEVDVKGVRGKCRDEIHALHVAHFLGQCCVGDKKGQSKPRREQDPALEQPSCTDVTGGCRSAFASRKSWSDGSTHFVKVSQQVRFKSCDPGRVCGHIKRTQRRQLPERCSPLPPPPPPSSSSPPSRLSPASSNTSASPTPFPLPR